MNRRELLVGCSTALAFQVSSIDGIFANSYPARPVKLIVTGVPGSAIDLVTRALADRSIGGSQAKLHRGRSSRSGRQPRC